MRAVMNGVMHILSTGCQWRYIPKDFPPRSTLHDYFTWWICDGTLDRIHHALYVECREKAEREASQPHRLHHRQPEREERRKKGASSSRVRRRQTDQGQETAYSRRHARSVAARDRSFRWRWSSTRRSWARSVFAPLAVSRQTFSAPAARNCFTCASTLWPSVDTRA
jgi:transposase